MIMERNTEEVYHRNGQLSYRASIGILSKAHSHLYEKRRMHPDGYEWVYIGVCGKWDEKGKETWVLKFSEKGELLK